VWGESGTEAIDCCGGDWECGGNCHAEPLYPPAGGTIMSYCFINPVGVNLNIGFHPEVLAVMKNSIANAECVESCPIPCPKYYLDSDDDGYGDPAVSTTTCEG